MLDTYTETFQGIHGLINNYKTYPIINDPKKCVPYFKKLLNNISKTVIPTKDTYLKNILDTIYELVYKTIYMLTYLK